MSLDNIVRHEEFLKEFMEPDYGLLDKLRANESLTVMEIQDIRGETSYHRRNSRLLKYIRNKSRTGRLVEALKDTRQTHIVNYLTANGERTSEFGDNWPLTANELKILDVNCESLVNLINSSELIRKMYSAEIINSRQLDYIFSKGTSFEKNETLLDILRRRSIYDYKRTIQFLRQTNQDHIAILLENGGVFALVHASHPRPSSVIDGTEEEIVTQFIKFIGSSDRLKEINRILENFELRIIALQRSHSIDLHVHCTKPEELNRLKQMEKTGRLEWIVVQLFIQLLSSRQYAGVTVRNMKIVSASQIAEIIKFTVALPENHYKKCLSYFHVVDWNEMSLTKEVDVTLRELRRTTLEWLPKRNNTITQLQMIIEKLNTMTKDVAIAQTVGSSVGIAGGAALITGLVLAPFTFGASLALTVGGGIAVGLGTTTNIGATISEIVIDRGEMETAKNCLEEDDRFTDGIKKNIDCLSKSHSLLLNSLLPDELHSPSGASKNPNIRVFSAAKSEAAARMTLDAASFMSAGGNVAVPVRRKAFAEAIAASQKAAADSVAALVVAQDIANLELSSRRLTTGARRDNAKKLEAVVKDLAESRDVLVKYLTDLQ